MKTNSSWVNESERGSHCPPSISSSESESDPDESIVLNPLKVGENTWYENPALDVHDPRAGMPCYTLPPRMVWTAAGVKMPMDYFNIFVPESFLEGIVSATNDNIEDENDHIHTWDLRRFIAAMYAMTLVRRSNIHDYWNIVDDTFVPASEFGSRIQMCYNRFSFIRKHLRFGPEDSSDKGFECVRFLFEEFNNILHKVFIPGPDLVMDESTSRWKGGDDKRETGPPALTHMKGKPENVSFMIKRTWPMELVV